VQEKNDEIISQNKVILESIGFAKTIQKEIISTQGKFLERFPDSFVLDEPKEIIGGDFLWYYEVHGLQIIAVVDCYGHGIPGSIMTIAVDFLLNKIVKEEKITQPERVLEKLDHDIFNYFERVENSRENVNGADIGICTLEGGTLHYAGARRPLVRISGGKTDVYKGQPKMIGGVKPTNNKHSIKPHSMKLVQGDCYYMFTDGIPDQFTGENLKQLGKKALLSKLEEISNLPMNTQKQKIESFIFKESKNYEQLDDMFMMGFRVQG
jgi:serine phosphatase RsbU (regulator of sigma subunit)